MANVLSNALFGTNPQFQQVQRFQPQQTAAFNQILQQALTGLQPGNYGQNFAPIASQARQQFYGSTIPSLAERFTSFGGRHSSGFQQALGQAGATLESNLAAQQAQFGQNDIRNLLAMLNIGLTPQFEQAYLPGTTGLIGGLFGNLGTGLGQLGGYGLSRLLGGLF